MPKPPEDLGISQESFERLLLQEHWLAIRPELQDDSDERKLQILLAEGTPSEDQIGVIRQFVALVDKGITPPAVLLAAVAKGLRTFLSVGGPQKLDEAFFGPGRQGKKPPLIQRLKDEKIFRVYWFMWSLIQRDTAIGKRPRKVRTAAGDAIKHFGLRMSPPTLESEYKRNRASFIFREFTGAMKGTMKASKGR